MRRVALAQVGDQSAECRELFCVRLIGDEIGIEGRVRAHTGDERIQFLAFGWHVEVGGVEERVVQLGPQTVALGDIQFGFAAPNHVPAALGHLLGGGIGHGRAGPVGDDRLADVPGGRWWGVGGPEHGCPNH